MLDDILRGLTWLGHDAFRLRAGGRVIYFDPYQLPIGNHEQADLILVSHDHFDHCSPVDILRLRKAETVIVANPAAAAKCEGRVKVMRAGERLVLDDIKIEAVPAYNLNKKFHPREHGGLGFIVRVAGVRIYHAGDTDHIPEMAAIRADLALLPVSGTYVMTAEEAAAAALEIKPRVAMPMHFGSVVGSLDDARRFAALLADKIRVVLPEQG